MKRTVLLVCSQIPYPCVNGGIERLVADYEASVFCDFDVYLLFYRSGDPIQMYHRGRPTPGPITAESLLAMSFALVVLFNYDIDFQQDGFIRPLLARFPCFQFLQAHPVAGMDDGHFRGTIAQSSAQPHANVFIPGAFYDASVFFRQRKHSDEFVVCIARIHEDKNQLELVRGYKERIYDKYGLPLYLAGGGGLRDDDDPYFKEVMKFVDGSAVVATADPERPRAPGNWLRSPEVAALLHRARVAVMPSAQETFCVALLEALACGTTCVVNGRYHGFAPGDLGPRVFGNLSEKSGSILDWLDLALRNDVRIDASAWAGKFALMEIKPKLLRFIQERLA